MRRLIGRVSRAYHPLLVAGTAVLSGLVQGSLAGCSAGGGVDDEPGGNVPDGAPIFGDGSPLLPDLAGSSDGPNFGAQGTGCNQLQLGFEAQTPTVLIVVDRSSSQWDGYPNHSWDPMKTGILDVVQRVQSDIRMGVLTYTGQAGGACPDLLPAIADVSFAKNNYDAIRAGLDGIDAPPYKGETPTAATIQAALPALLADPSPGEKVMLLVTDGDPDFCNDPDPVCPMDAVVAAVQNAHAQGVTTTVFGLRRNGVALSEQHLRDVANAGVGQPVALPPQVGRVEDYANRCNLPAQGVYSAQSGNAEFFQANGTNQVELGDALDAAIYGVRSCIFELDGAVEIDPDRAQFANITIDSDPPLTYGDPNGWQLRTPTQVELLGAACGRLKAPQTRGIDFDFPCDLFIPR